MNCNFNCFHTHRMKFVPRLRSQEYDRQIEIAANEELNGENEVYFEDEDKLFHKNGIETLHYCDVTNAQHIRRFTRS